jgi:hypothetical protein
MPAIHPLLLPVILLALLCTRANSQTSRGNTVQRYKGQRYSTVDKDLRRTRTECELLPGLRHWCQKERIDDENCLMRCAADVPCKSEAGDTRPSTP